MLSAKEKEWREERLARIKKWEEDCPWEDFIDDDNISKIIEEKKNPDKKEILEIVSKAKENALTGAMLSPEEVGALTNVQDPELWEAIFEAANWIKCKVYGNRIVLFSPLYISSPCVNNCAYCGFRHSNKEVHTKTLTMEELEEEIKVLTGMGQKRLIVVYGEHPASDYKFMCKTIEKIYSIKNGKGEIRRVNVNAPPLFVDEYEAVKAVGIGTYQVFQETYHHPTYHKMHPANTLKGQYKWRQFALHRALQAGIDDVAIGALFGLYDWRFELLGLLYHAMSLEKEFGVGSHTISYPRLEHAVNTPITSNSPYLVDDEDFKKIVAIIRLMCPYTGSILTAREAPALRRDLIQKGGISQMDAGTRIAVGGYAEMKKEHIPDKQQFLIQDTRSLDDFIYDLCKDGYLPSFCTACYREGRTGDNFMPLAKHATVKNFCIGNGILTFKEYLLDYASPRVKEIGEKVIIPNYLKWLDEHVPQAAKQVKELLQKEEAGERDQHL
ncbi:[FeFe] hydrogenase H-cluster radical SAM maturase HydG [Desulfohalobiaceae bacterium Ax17]|uniref:[FeFe] hydrogenase H-cluster radical SAM maturase HydG n=1 Tax=Desulfovulcanus ferrireducens TaxID=2831190 RepID=UPI00207B9BDD|nr:[FeFe] hydrogenase H-cluster radical SAM maturase HydG [Desulfovulcanus ferrireducens]MBT8764114.1 [FeFe] hydrogenase H-cluster radical SAM maturase HydG [Desulfovulcanus ferrireducens]